MPRKSNVGDGPRPSADVRILKGRAVHASPHTPAGSGTPSAVSNSVPQFPQFPANNTAGSAISAKGAELAASLGLPADRPAFLALAAMLGEHLALTHQTAVSIRRRAKLGYDDPLAARLAARALAAGLDPDCDAVGKALESIDDSGRDPHGSDGSSGGRGDRKHETDEESRGRADAGGETRALRTIGDALKALAVEAGLDDGLASLAAPGPDGDAWVCVPFNVPYRGVDFAGIMRIWYDASSVRAGRLVADIRSGDGRRLLDVREESGGRVLRYHADDMNERKAFAEAFSAFGTVITDDLESGDLAELRLGLKVDRGA